ncbi:MAG: tetratricopeptide repeat protein [Candidatus Coatesbacteria bacterium]|nr:tetratricopeptide repeat protein [Candidatus Coatesbacteria bacterium]
MLQVNDKRAILNFGASLSLGVAYTTLRAVNVLPRTLFPTTAELESVELLGLLLLVPALFLFCRGLARTTSLGFVAALKARIESTDERAFVALAMLFVFSASLLLLIFVLGGVPHVQDSIALMFQAKVFAIGKVGVQAPEHLEFFQYPFMVVEKGLLHAKYFPMHALVLALGVPLNAELLVQPILAALTLLLIYILARELYGQLTAKATVLLVAVSPFFLYMHTSFLSHTTSLLFFSLFVFSLVKSLKTSSKVFPLVAGLSLGLMFNTRPQTAYVVALALVPTAVKELLARRRRILTAALFGIGLIPAGALAMSYRYPFTGKLFGMPFDFSNPADKLGFHPDVGVLYGSIGHTPLKALLNFAKNLIEMNSNLFGFPMASLLLFFIVLFAPRKDKWERAFVAVPVALVFFHIFYWVDGVCFGARYWFSCVPLFAMLTIRGISRFGPAFAQGEIGRRAAVLFVLMLVLVGLADYHPRRAMVHKNSYWSVNNKVADAVRERNIHNAVIFMQTEDDPLSYGAGYLHNSPTFDDDVVYAHHLGRFRDRVLFESYPGRTFFICTYGTTSDREPLFELLHPLPDKRALPEDVTASLDMASYLTSTQRFDEAARLFSWAILISDEMTIDSLPLDDELFVRAVLPRIEFYQPTAYVLIGTRLFEIGKFDLAKNAVESAVRMSPRTVCPRLLLDDPAFRKEVIDKLDIRGKESLLSLAAACYSSSQYERAVRYLERSIDVYGESYENLVRLGHALLHAGRFERALWACNRLELLRPHDEQVNLMRARALVSSGDIPGAEAAIRTALEGHPATTDLWVTMGEYALSISDTERARKAFQIALASDELNVDASIGLAQILLSDGLIDEGLNVLDRIKPITPANREVNLLLGIAHHLRHEAPAASEHLSRARRLSDRAKLEWDDLPIVKANPLSRYVFQDIEAAPARDTKGDKGA